MACGAWHELLSLRPLPPAECYLYDAEIIRRVQNAILVDRRFDDTSIWFEGPRRWVWLRGCVRRPQQAAALEQLVRGIDDVEAVINELKPREA